MVINLWLFASRATKKWNSLGSDGTYNILYICSKWIGEYEIIITDTSTIVNQHSDGVVYKKAKWTTALNTCTKQNVNIQYYSLQVHHGDNKIRSDTEEAPGCKYSLHANLRCVFDFFQKCTIPEIYLCISIQTEVRPFSSQPNQIHI